MYLLLFRKLLNEWVIYWFKFEPSVMSNLLIFTSLERNVLIWWKSNIWIFCAKEKMHNDHLFVWISLSSEAHCYIGRRKYTRGLTEAYANYSWLFGIVLSGDIILWNIFVPALRNIDVNDIGIQQHSASRQACHGRIDLFRQPFDSRLISWNVDINYRPRSCELILLDY